MQGLAQRLRGGGGMQGLAEWRGLGGQGLAWLLDCGVQGLVRRARPGFGGLGLAGMHDHTEKPQGQGGGCFGW